MNSFERLPEMIARGLREKGISKLTPPQEESLAKGLLEGENLVVVAPTASGKTLVGEIALVNSYLKGRKGIYTTPLKALAYEKYSEFKFWERYGLRVGLSVGDYVVTQEEIESLEAFDIVVTTYERLDSILRRNPRWINRVGVIVIDELHMIGDRSRGHIVEMIAIRAKLRGIQIVGLSATIGNPEELASWLNARLVKSDWRPVKLYELITHKGRDGWVMAVPKELQTMFGGNAVIQVGDLTRYWILRAIREGFNVLEFKYSRKAVEELAHSYSPILCENLPKEARQELDSLASQLRDVLHDFEYEKLHPLIRCGAAYHHAGLSYNARRFIEQAFRDRLLKYVAATPTLAMGVNLPARVVILNTKYFSGGSTSRISILEYKQLSGRAGRPQYDPYGIVVVAKDAASFSEAKAYVNGNPEAVESRLLDGHALRRHVLSVVASSEAVPLDSLINFFSASLGAIKLSREDLEERIRRAVVLLEELSMIKSRRGKGGGAVLSATKLGAVTSWLYVDPVTSFLIVAGLANKKAVSDLYYLSLIGMSPDFSDVHLSRNAYEWFEEYLSNLEEGSQIPPRQLELEVRDPEVDWLRGCLLGLVLNDWIEEVPEKTIVERYGVELGDLAVIRETAEWLLYSAHMVTKVVGLENHSERLKVLVDRVRHGVKEDALELVQLRYIGRVRARTLLQNNIRSVKDIVDKELLVRKLLGEGWGEKVLEEARKLLGLSASQQAMA